MNYLSFKDIAKMKARGFDPLTIAEAEEMAYRCLDGSEVAQEVMHQIESAFAGVTLGSGVGLREGRAMDDWADDATRAARRLEDEQSDWHEIPTEDLNKYECSLSYFDAEGMRFHLPGYLLADLRGEGHSALWIPLTFRDEGSARHRTQQFALLSPAQRAAVRAYLLFILLDPDEKPHQDDIAHALAEYWKPPSTPLST